MVFLKCMTALFNPLHRRGKGIKWGLVSYTVIMFSLATVHIAAAAYSLSVAFIEHRNFPGGPGGYQAAENFKTISVIYTSVFCLNNWLADGLLVSSLFDAVVSCLCG